MDATGLLRALLGEFVRAARRQEDGTPSVQCHFKRQVCEGLVSAAVHLSHTAEPGVETLPAFFRGILASDVFTPSLVDATRQGDIQFTYSATGDRVIHRFLVHSVDRVSGADFSQLPPIPKSEEIIFCGLEVVVQLAGCIEDALLCLHGFIAEGCALLGVQFAIVLTVENFPQSFTSAIHDPLATAEVDEEAGTLTLIYNPGFASPPDSRLSLFSEWHGGVFGCGMCSKTRKGGATTVEIILGFVGLGDDMEDVQAAPGEALHESPMGMEGATHDDTDTAANAELPRQEDPMEEAPGRSSTEENPDDSMEEASPPVTPEEVLPAGTEEAQPSQLLQVPVVLFSEGCRVSMDESLLMWLKDRVDWAKFGLKCHFTETFQSHGTLALTSLVPLGKLQLWVHKTGDWTVRHTICSAALTAATEQALGHLKTLQPREFVSASQLKAFDALPHLASYVTCIIHSSSNPSFQEECCQILGVHELNDVEGSIADSLEEIVIAMSLQNVKGRTVEARLSWEE